MTLTSSIPVLRSSDYATARSFWTLTLGFARGEEGGNPPRFGIFHRGRATVFVDAGQGGDPDPSPGWRAYFHSDDVDALAAEFSARGAAVSGPMDTARGMREITLRDPDGNLLCFGQDLPK
ncbi:MAG: hypothetical protein GY717_05240 [Rhodobacteraceae bacterium]|nr:hypothetical protein [Paracoccaceae bacterium]